MTLVVVQNFRLKKQHEERAPLSEYIYCKYISFVLS